MGRIGLVQQLMERNMFKKVTQSIKGIRDENAWHKIFGPKAPKGGDPSTDFQLSDVKGKNTIRLSQFLGKRPVALVFGSFT